MNNETKFNKKVFIFSNKKNQYLLIYLFIYLFLFIIFDIFDISIFLLSCKVGKKWVEWSGLESL